MTMPRLTTVSIYLINIVEDSLVFFLGFKMFRSNNICLYVFLQQKCASHFGRETSIEKSVFKITNINLHLIRQSFQGHRCESVIAIFAWRVTSNFALVVLRHFF